ncbi:efflux RND transporter periplasmic adaptor subunit [Catenuloplanes sp. NPDC051500]|uniref:efflux RND transporter periplasmic adaptor subunit n=1 Tax=Catenuloplanes sp. NPDC051500 TaxID=3363959 RepID=UPI00379D2753
MKARIGITAAAIVAMTAAGLLYWNGRPAPAAEAADAGTVATAEVVKTDLADTRTLQGALGYGTSRQVKGQSGTVTWLPATGVTITRGEQLVRVDDRPVSLFYGDLPLYRELSDPRTTGRDVVVVADNLRALGYAVGGLGGNAKAPRYTEVLIAAVKRWQRDTGRPENGVIGTADVIVLPGEVRVDSLAVQTGDAAAATLMGVTPTKKVITVRAEPGDAAAVKAGTAVTLTLPDGATTPGTVTAVGTALSTDGESGSGPQTLAVTVTADDPAAVAAFDAGAVSVEVTSATRQGVLAVPVGSLLALSEGGHAVQLADGTLVAVETGLFARGLVEVTGTGLAEGQTVVTTS